MSRSASLDALARRGSFGHKTYAGTLVGRIRIVRLQWPHYGVLKIANDFQIERQISRSGSSRHVQNCVVFPVVTIGTRPRLSCDPRSRWR